MINALEIFLRYVGYFFTIYLFGYATFLMISIIVGSITLYNNKRMQKFKNVIEHGFYVPVSIIVPAYNEEITVADTVNSLLNLDYRLYEIIVVNDGSKDDTAKVMIESFNLHQVKKPINRQINCKKEIAVYTNTINNITITFISKENGGKADALNMGINASNFPYFVCLDADSVLQKDSLTNIVKPLLRDDSVIACGGMIGVSNGVVIENGYVKNYRLPENLLSSIFKNVLKR